MYNFIFPNMFLCTYKNYNRKSIITIVKEKQKYEIQ